MKMRNKRKKEEDGVEDDKMEKKRKTNKYQKKEGWVGGIKKRRMGRRDKQIIQKEELVKKIHKIKF